MCTFDIHIFIIITGSIPLAGGLLVPEGIIHQVAGGLLVPEGIIHQVAGGLLVPKGIIHQVVYVSALT